MNKDNKNKDILTKPYQVNHYGQNYQRAREILQQQQQYEHHNNQNKSKPPSSHDIKRNNPIQIKDKPIKGDRYRNLFNENPSNAGIASQKPANKYGGMINRPASGNKIVQRPESGKSPALPRYGYHNSNDNNNNVQRRIISRPANAPVQYQNPYSQPAGKPSRVVYEKMNYENYCNRNKIQPYQNYHYNRQYGQPQNIGNLYGDNNFYRNGPKIVNHKQ